MTSLLMIAKGAVVMAVTLASTAGIVVGMILLLYGRTALSGDRQYATDVTFSIAAGVLLVVTLCFIAAFVMLPPTSRRQAATVGGTVSINSLPLGEVTDDGRNTLPVQVPNRISRGEGGEGAG